MRSRSTDSSDSPGAVSSSNCSPLDESCTRCPVPVTARQDRGMPPAPFPPGACSPGAWSRRRFIGGALGAAGGLVVAGSLADVAWADVAGAETSRANPKTFFPLVLSSDLAASAQAQRMVFALSHSTAKGIVYASGPSVTVRFRKKGGQWSEAQTPAFDRAGLPKG